LPPGLSLAFNGTGRPERVLSPGESGGVHVTVNVNGLSDPVAVGLEVERSLRAVMNTQRRPIRINTG
jgi:hypothetical protein